MKDEDVPHRADLEQCTDEELMAIIQRNTGGNGAASSLIKAAANVLFSRFFPVLSRYVERTLSLQDQAQDVAVETLTHALLRKAHSFENRGPFSFRNWIHRIAYNRGCTLLKREKRRSPISLDDLIKNNEPSTKPVYFTEEEFYQLLVAASLSEESIFFLSLTYVHDLAPRDIEACTGTGAAEVSRVLYRAKNKLRSYLKNR